MRRKEREITDRAAIERVLTSALICRVAMFDGEWPYVVPVNFGFRDRSLYFHSALEGAKLDILKRRPRVCFEADADTELVKAETPCQWGFRYRSVIGFGMANLVTEPVARRVGLDIVMGHYAIGPFAYNESSLARTLVVRIDIERMTGKQSGYDVGA